MIVENERIKKAQEIIKNADYYGDDDLIYCGKCKTPKQVRINCGGDMRIFACTCDCEKKANEEKAERQKKQERAAYLQRIKAVGFPEKGLREWDFTKDDGANEKITNICKKYVQHFPDMLERGKGLLLFGEVGTGKTFFAACILNALLENGYPGLMTNFARIANTIQGMHEGRQRYIDDLAQYDLLVIDDLATERDTEYMAEVVQMIIDTRYRAGKPVIITTNLSAEELKNPADIKKQRAYSRLLEMTVPVEVKGNDRRKNKLAADYAELKDILGL